MERLGDVGIVVASMRAFDLEDFALETADQQTVPLLQSRSHAKPDTQNDSASELKVKCYTIIIALLSKSSQSYGALFENTYFTFFFRFQKT